MCGRRLNLVMRWRGGNAGSYRCVAAKRTAHEAVGVAVRNVQGAEQHIAGTIASTVLDFGRISGNVTPF
jgi:hypothetical protein